MNAFGETVEKPEYINYCCDVCDRGDLPLEERSTKIQILIRAIDELGNRGKAEISEWIRGGQVAWMKAVIVDRTSQNSAYECSPPGLSKPWWRRFVRQAAVAGYIESVVKSGEFDCMYSVFANLRVTDKGRALGVDESVYLPSLSEFDKNSHSLGVCLLQLKKRSLVKDAILVLTRID